VPIFWQALTFKRIELSFGVLCSLKMDRLRQKKPRLKLDAKIYKAVRNQVLARDGWRCQSCGSTRNLHVHHICAPEAS